MLTRLELRDFRNLEPLQLEFGAGAHLVLGENGAGKTSLLEAIYLLATTRSFRTSQTSDCRRHGASGFEIQGEIEGVARTRLGVALQGKTFQRYVNQNRTTLAQHLAVQPVVCWTSRDREIIEGSPGERRKFIDRGVASLRPSAIETFGEYRRALEAKRRLLSQGAVSRDELASWNGVLASAASRLVRRRAEYVEALEVAFREVVERSGLGFPDIEIRYRPSPKCALEGSQALLGHFEEIASREIKLERPLVGPHRDELDIRWDRHKIRRVASAGERKALGLMLLAAQGRILEQAGRPPLYLLDDADTELDQQRLNALWQILGTAQQVIATSNRPQIWDASDGLIRWSCDAGGLVRTGT